MWCDNCLLVFPLRAGAIGWGVFVFAYSLAGSIFLLRDGQYLFFFFPEWQIYGGIGMGVASAAGISVVALSNRSYIWTRAVNFLWPFIIVICAVRAIIMIVQLQRGASNIQWECDNGGQQWIDANTANQTTVAPFPSGFCAAGVANISIAFIGGLLADLACQMYMYFLMWRFQTRLRHYHEIKGPHYGYGGYP